MRLSKSTSPFIVLLFSLYVISGGIRLSGDLAARPLTNTIFLLVGAGIASFIGTTGASMLLIRPGVEYQQKRESTKFILLSSSFFSPAILVEPFYLLATHHFS